MTLVKHKKIWVRKILNLIFLFKKIAVFEQVVNPWLHSLNLQVTQMEIRKLYLKLILFLRDLSNCDSY